MVKAVKQWITFNTPDFLHLIVYLDDLIQTKYSDLHNYLIIESRLNIFKKLLMKNEDYCTDSNLFQKNIGGYAFHVQDDVRKGCSEIFARY